MKIAFLHFWTMRLPRGVETLTQSLANALAAQGADVTILTARRTREPLVVPLPGVCVREFPTFRYFEAVTIVPFYVQDLIRNKYDVIVTFFADFGEGPALAIADHFHHSRLVLYLTFPVESAPHRYRAYKKYGWNKRADVILADAEYTARRGEEFFHRPVRVLPSGTDPDRFRPDAARRAATRRELGLQDDEVVLLNVAALEKRKGAWRVIEALPAVRAQCPNVRYLVLGDGTERAALETRAKELDVAGAVVFAGTTANLPPYYNAADIFVLLSDAEAGSIALLEAMASGLPAVVSSAGGFGEVVDATNGRIVNQNDTSAIADAIIELAHDADLRPRLGVAGRATVVEKFAWSRIVEQLYAFIQN